MPVTYRRSRSGKGFEIVEKSSGRVVGHSDTEEKAAKAVAVRNMRWREKKERS
jgi:hypothetical protein